VLPAVEVLEGRVVRGDEPGARTALDAHVADGHPLLHGQRPDGVTGVLEDVPRPAADPDPGDEGEDDVLGADAGGQPSVHLDLVRLRVALEQGLGGQDHLDFARPDPEGERTECAVRARVRVAAHDRHPRLGQAELWSDDMDDALGRVADAVQRDVEFGAVGLELLDLGEGHGVDEWEAPVGRRDRVVRRRDGLARATDPDPAGTQARERLGAGDLVDEMEVDREDRRGARILGHDMIGPDLVDDGPRRCCCHLASVPDLRAPPGNGRSGPKAAPINRAQAGGGPGRLCPGVDAGP